MLDQIEALKQYFDVEERGAEVHLYCKVRRRGWALPKEGQQIGSSSDCSITPAPTGV